MGQSRVARLVVMVGSAPELSTFECMSKREVEARGLRALHGRYRKRRQGETETMSDEESGESLKA